MAEINEAYSVLSDPQKRREYDASRRTRTGGDDAAFSDENNEPVGSDPLDNDWQIVSRFYPELKDIEYKLSRLSPRLVRRFRSYLLENKEFDRAGLIARKIENEYLTIYFGDNKEIIDFAKKLILEGNQKAAKDLNKIIKLLGEKIDAEKIISTIVNDYNIGEYDKSDNYEKTEEKGVLISAIDFAQKTTTY